MPLILVLLGACACARSGTHARFAASSTPAATRPPASAAGGACYLLEYEIIEQNVGASFDVAAASATGDTFTCVLQTRSGSYPDLTLAVTAVDVDPTAFMSTVSPEGSAAVTTLGKIGYSAVVPAGAGAGPGVEIGWLSGNDRLLVLRYRFPGDAASGGVDAVTGKLDALTGKLVALARRIDLNSV